MVYAVLMLLVLLTFAAIWRGDGGRAQWRLACSPRRLHSCSCMSCAT